MITGNQAFHFATNTMSTKHKIMDHNNLLDKYAVVFFFF